MCSHTHVNTHTLRYDAYQHKSNKKAKQTYKILKCIHKFNRVSKKGMHRKKTTRIHALEEFLKDPIGYPEYCWDAITLKLIVNLNGILI